METLKCSESVELGTAPTLMKNLALAFSPEDSASRLDHTAKHRAKVAHRVLEKLRQQNPYGLLSFMLTVTPRIYSSAHFELSPYLTVTYPTAPQSALLVEVAEYAGTAVSQTKMFQDWMSLLNESGKLHRIRCFISADFE